MAPGSTPDAPDDVAAAFRDETRRLVAARFPIAASIFLALMAVAYSIELIYFPQRWRALSFCYAGFALISAAGAAALRRHPERAVLLTLLASVALAFALTAYLALVQRSGELCLLALIGFLTGQVVQFPWGVAGQTAASIGAIAAYLWALSVGASTTLPIPYTLFALCAHALMTIIGARLLEAYRFAAFRKTAEAARHAEESARANAAKSDFLATVSHELRTPLNIIVGYTDLLQEGAFPTPTEQADALSRIQQQSRQLLDLIQSMLDLNRLEAGGIPLVTEEFAVGAALDGVRGSLPANWCKPDVRLRWETAGAQAAIMRSDRGKLEMILRNLIHNALKYTERGEVVIAATLVDASLPAALARALDARLPAQAVRLAISDTGQGIHPDDLQSIFEMFRQGSNGGPPRGGGVGLGLYIVKQLTGALGGTIEVESRLGAGARFTVSLPLIAARA